MKGDIRRSPARRQERKATTARARSGASVTACGWAPRAPAVAVRSAGPRAAARPARARGPPAARPRSCVTAARGSRPQGYAPSGGSMCVRHINPPLAARGLLRADHPGGPAAAAHRLGGGEEAVARQELDPGHRADLPGRPDVVAVRRLQLHALRRGEEPLLRERERAVAL